MAFNLPNPFNKNKKSNVLPFEKPTTQKTIKSQPKQTLMQKAGLTLGGLGLFVGGG